MNFTAWNTAALIRYLKQTFVHLVNHMHHIHQNIKQPIFMRLSDNMDNTSTYNACKANSQ